MEDIFATGVSLYLPPVRQKIRKKVRQSATKSCNHNSSQKAGLIKLKLSGNFPQGV